MNTADYFSNAPWKAGFEVPNFKENCINCFRITKDYAKFSYRTKSGFLTINCVCLDCIEEVIQYRYRIRNVSEMTKELVKTFEMKEYHKAADIITLYRKVTHI